MLKLMYITNDPEVAKIAQDEGVDRIFVDMEYIGKAERQGGMDTVQSHHTVEDVKRIREVVTTSELMVRVNPWHEATDEYCSSVDEINAVIDAGADVVMLPYFKTVKEVKNFLDTVNKRARTMLLVETCPAVEQLETILDLGPDEVHIGINDLGLCKKCNFMFENFSDGSVEEIMKICHKAGVPCGVGGVASLGRGTLSSEYIIAEHYRLGSEFVILSRSFCNTNLLKDYDEIRLIFHKGLAILRAYERECQRLLDQRKFYFFENNKKAMDIQIRLIAEQMRNSQN